MRQQRGMRDLRYTFASVVIECQEDPGDETSARVGSMAVEGYIAQGSAISCAGHSVC